MKNIFSSSNNFFLQKLSVLKEQRKNVDLFLQLKGYELSQRVVYLKAYDHMVQFPQDFNGASMTEDLPDIGNLELAAMLHDYLYVVLNASVELHFIRLADNLLFAEMRKMNKSTWNLGYRKYALIVIRRFWIWFCRNIKGRKMSIDNQIAFLEIYKTMT